MHRLGESQCLHRGESPVKHMQTFQGLSGNVMSRVDRVTAPDGLRTVGTGSYCPDLALLYEYLNAIRVVGVVTTNPTPAGKLKPLAKRGVEVIQGPVGKESNGWARKDHPKRDTIGLHNRRRGRTYLTTELNQPDAAGFCRRGKFGYGDADAG